MVALSVLSFWVAMWAESHFTIFTVLYGLWGQFISSDVAWLGLIFMVGWVLVVEEMAKYILSCILNKKYE